MSLVSGINHVAVLTDDLTRFVEFYRGVFELPLLFEETTPAFRHAILRAGPSCWLHPVQVFGSPHGAGSPRMFERGHLDHIALSAASAEAFERSRQRLVGLGGHQRRGRRPGGVSCAVVQRSRWYAGGAVADRRRRAA